MSFYNEIIKTGIVFRRPWRFFQSFLSIARKGEKASKPLVLKFENSTLCNLRCEMCPLSRGLRRKTGVLGFENFKKLYDELRPPYLNLTGIGEPLLNKDIFKIINYARIKGSIVKMDTNATLLDSEKIRKLLDTGINFISVSIDGTNKKSYEKIRRGAKFEKVIENLKNLIKIKNNRKSKTKIHLFFVLQKENIQEIAEFIKFGDNLGVDSINGTVIIPLGGNKNQNKSNIDKTKMEQAQKEISNLKGKTRARLNIEGIEDFLKDKENKNKPCFWPWYQAAVTWDGYLTPCCLVADNEIVFGNVFQENFMKIWNNEKFRKFRKQLAKKRTGICESCGVDESFIENKLKPIRFMKKK